MRGRETDSRQPHLALVSPETSRGAEWPPIPPCGRLCSSSVTQNPWHLSREAGGHRGPSLAAQGPWKGHGALGVLAVRGGPPLRPPPRSLRPHRSCDSLPSSPHTLIHLSLERLRGEVFVTLIFKWGNRCPRLSHAQEITHLGRNRLASFHPGLRVSRATGDLVDCCLRPHSSASLRQLAPRAPP